MSLATSHGPTSMPLRTSARGAGHQAAAVPPGQPHLLAARVEGDRQAGHHPVADPERRVLQEQPRLGVDERRGAAVRDRDALRRPVEPEVKITHASSSRPGSSGSRGWSLAAHHHGPVVADDRGDVGLVEDQPGALVGVVGVDGHVGRAGQQDAEDRDVEVGGAAVDADADLVAAADAVRVELDRELVGGLGELGVGQHVVAGVDRGLVVGLLDRGPEDVDQRARRRCQLASTQGVHVLNVLHRGERTVTVHVRRARAAGRRVDSSASIAACSTSMREALLRSASKARRPPRRPNRRLV